MRIIMLEILEYIMIIVACVGFASLITGNIFLNTTNSDGFEDFVWIMLGGLALVVSAVFWVMLFLVSFFA